MRLPAAAALLLAAALCSPAPAQPTPVVIQLDHAWRFGPDTKEKGLITGWARPDWDDSGWPRIDAAACWEVQGFTGYDGLGWYRRKVNIPEGWAGKRRYLVIGGADDELSVYLNGERVSFDQPSGQPWSRPLVLDITDRAPAGRQLCIAFAIRDFGGPGGLVGHVLLTTLSGLSVRSSPMPRSSRQVEVVEGEGAVAVTPKLPEGPLPESGPVLRRTSGFGNFFAVSSSKAALFGTEGGKREVWLFPVKAAAGIELSFIGRDGAPIPASEALREYQVRPESATFVYALPQGSITEVIFAPEAQQGIVFLYRAEVTEPVDVVVSYDPMFLPMWPARVILSRPTRVAWHKGRGALLFTVNERRFSSVFGAFPSPGPADERFEQRAGVADRFYARVALGPDNPQGVMVIAGGPGYANAALGEYDSLMADPAGAYAATVARWRDLLDRTPAFECPDPVIEEAFLWAKVGLAKHVVESPIGKGYVAGMGPSGRRNRPGFCWYFGRDSSWESAAGNAIGLQEASRANLRLKARFQKGTGKCYHEISLSHDEVGSRDYCYFAGDATPLFVLDIWDLYRWSGDESVIRSNWEGIVRAITWGYENDIDGDLLIDNPPAGHNWFDYGSKNMIDLVAIWQRALSCGARMAELMETEQLARKWRADSLAVLTILRSEFWNERRGWFYDRKSPDGSMLDLPTCNPAFPLAWGLIEPDHASRALAFMAGAAMTTDWGLRTTASDQDIYDPAGYHEGSVWPFVTGAGTLACYRNGRAWQGYGLLHANARLTRDDALGCINEVIRADRYEFIGTPMQGWSQSMVIQGVVEGMWGIDADAPSRTLTVAPQFPVTWARARLPGLRVGDARFDISFEGGEDRLKVTVSGAHGWRIRLSPVLPAGTKLLGCRLNGRKAAPRIEESPDCVRFTLICEGASEVEAQLHFVRGPELVPLTFNPQPGAGSVGPRLVDIRTSEDETRIAVDGRAGGEGAFRIHLPRRPTSCRGGKMHYEGLGVYRVAVEFPPTDGQTHGWVRREVVISLR